MYRLWKKKYFVVVLLFIVVAVDHISKVTTDSWMPYWQGVIPWHQVAEFNVRDLGAAGNGKDDDTAAVQMAFDKVSNGGRLVFPKGIYNVNPSLLGVTIKENVSVEIIGQGNAVLMPTGKMSVLKVTSTTEKGMGRVRITGLTIDGARAGEYLDSPSGLKGIEVKNLKGVEIRRNKIRKLYGTGIHAQKITRLLVKENQVLNTWGLNPQPDQKKLDNYGDGIYAAYCDGAVLENNNVYNNLRETNSVGRGGIVLEYAMEGCKVIGNRIHGYDRNLHIEKTGGRHRISKNYLSGSDLGFIYSENQKGSVITKNFITNKGCLPDDNSIISPRALVYLYSKKNKGSVFYDNDIKIVASGFRIPQYIFLSQSDFILIGDNSFESEGKKLPFQLHNVNNVLIILNDFKNIGEIRLGGKNSLIKFNWFGPLNKLPTAGR